MATTRDALMDAVGNALSVGVPWGVAPWGNTLWGGVVHTNVWRWRTAPLDAEELPAIVYRDIVNESVQETLNMAMGHRHNKLTVEVELIATGETTPTVLDEMIQQILSCVGSDETFDGRALATDYISDEVDLSHREYITGSALITLAIHYISDRWTI